MKNTKKKINPRHIPVSKADIDKAKAEATNEAVDAVMNIILYVLKDKHGATDEELGVFADEFRYVVDSINRGYITWKDLRDTLKKEYNCSWDAK